MADASAWGVQTGFHDITGAWKVASEGGVRAVLEAMGAESDRPPAPPPQWFAREGEPVSVSGRWVLQTEDGGEENVGGTIEGLPLGYHTLFHADDGRRVDLVVTPGRCHLPADLKTWGWAVQLYALRSRRSWGMGDLGVLQEFGRWAKNNGAGLVLINPLHAAVPVAQQEASPYYPSSRCFRNPLYLDVERVPGAADVVEVSDGAEVGRALNTERRIDRAEVFRLKMRALEAIHARTGADDGFERFVASGGALLQRYAVYCAIAEVHGPNWRRWPSELRHHDTFEVREFARENARRVRFHAWLQWQTEAQLQAAGAEIALMQDLAIGVDPGGADAWMWQDVIAPSMSVGAPPDEYNAGGQDWGLPPFDPWKLRAARYEPYIETVRAGLRHAGGLRFDHVMGLFRLYWIAAGEPATQGVYVRYPASDLLDILALESVRAGAYVVGEDLGTVEPEVRDELAARDVLSYRLFWFEPERPRTFPRHALAAVTTHDLPTVAGLWSGADIDAQRERRMQADEHSTLALRTRLRDWTASDDDAPAAQVTERVYRLLAEAPSAIVTATLDDALGVEERPNYPGTTGGTNWSLALPASLEDIEQDERVRTIGSILNER